MYNGLFNESLLRKYSKEFKPTHRQKELVREYVRQVENGLFKGETRNYLKFYDLILKDLLGYGLENVGFDEKVDTGKGRSEFVLKSDDKKFMILELKGQDVDLDKPQNRANDIRSPVDQAFIYAFRSGDVEWIFLSNYNEFRLYNYHKKTHYISFNAHDLLDNDTLKLFLLVFSCDSHIKEGYVDKLMEKTLVVERKLESEFYKLYNEARLMIIKELEHNNSFNRILAVHYAQLILNRYMFVCFAEDLGLLPGQITIKTISAPVKSHDLGRGRLWSVLNDLFLDINEGNSYKNIYGYNGGLFSENLENLKIRDLIEDPSFFRDTYQNWKFEEYEIDIQPLIIPYQDKINPIYKNLLTISQFDFASDLDVNI